MASGAKLRTDFLSRSTSCCRKWVRQQRNVLPPLDQARQAQADHVQTIVEILSQCALLHARIEVVVRRGNDAHIHRNRFGRTDRTHDPLLQRPQQFRLQGQRHVADLVEEQGAADRRLKQSLVGADRTGERTLGVAEQFRLEQVLGHRRAVDRLERVHGHADWHRGCALASNSLPVPESPVISTLASEAATSWAWRSTSSMAWLQVMMLARHASDWLWRPGAPVDSRIACATCASSSLASKGLGRKPNTPRRVAATASGIVP